MREFQGKNYWALILGGSKGLGKATAQKLAQHGMHICIVHRSRRSELPALNALLDTLRAEGVAVLHYNTDATQPVNCAETIRQFKTDAGTQASVRTLVHSIAKGNLKPMLGEITLQPDDFRLTLEAMSSSLYAWTQALLEAQLFAADARVLSFTSEGSTKAWKNYAAVSAAKAALEAITRSIALEMAPMGIRANCLMPGVTDTESLRMIPGHETLLTHSLQRSPYQRLTTPEDVANVVYLLCKNEAAWINGAVIPVNGGEHLQ